MTDQKVKLLDSTTALNDTDYLLLLNDTTTSSGTVDKILKTDFETQLDIGDSQLSANVTLQGNTFNGAGQLVQLESGAVLPAVDGSQLTGVTSTSVENVGTCTTAAATAEKAVTVPNFTLTANKIFWASFTNANTATTPTINVNSEGAKTLKFKDGIAVDATHPLTVQAGEKIEILYDGTDCILTGRAVYDSGWFQVAVNTVYTKTHGLGTANIKYIVLITDDTNGTNQRPVFGWSSDDGGSLYGFFGRAVTSSSIEIKTVPNYVGLGATGISLTSAYYKILAEAL